ncbi:MAG: response regulator [Bacillota bacterium]
MGRGMLLIVDDQPAIRQLIREALAGEGYEVKTAASGCEAIAFVAARRPDLIITDLKMPGMNGLEMLAEIQRIAPGIPVILITAYGELSSTQEAERVGVRRLLIKPFDINDLRAVVRRLLAEVSDTDGP